MSPCPPLIITRGFPLLINPFQGGVYLGRKLGKTLQGPSDLVRGVGINPVLPLIGKMIRDYQSIYKDLQQSANTENNLKTFEIESVEF